MTNELLFNFLVAVREGEKSGILLVARDHNLTDFVWLHPPQIRRVTSYFDTKTKTDYSSYTKEADYKEVKAPEVVVREAVRRGLIVFKVDMDVEVNRDSGSWFQYTSPVVNFSTDKKGRRVWTLSHDAKYLLDKEMIEREDLRYLREEGLDVDLSKEFEG